MANMNFAAVYPAYHPVFPGVCDNCSECKNSPELVADLDRPGRFYCDKCVFVYFLINMRDAFILRDSKELREYGGLYQK